MEQTLPQSGIGYTKITNELLEVIVQCPFTAAELRVLFIVIRRTYGWQKDEALLSYGLLSYLTKLDKRYTKKVVKRLIQKRVLFKKPSKNSNILGLNKNYIEWSLWITDKQDIRENTSKVFSQTPYRCLPRH